MLVLALDTSTAACSVALVELGVSPTAPVPAAGVAPAGHVLAERSAWDARRHGELLAPMISEVLAAARVRSPEVAAVVVGTGPGPFTSLRVGLVSAAAFAAALGIPVHGVCSLDGIGAATSGPVGVVTDARRSEVFWARYQDGARLGAPGVGAPAGVAAELRASGATRVTGPGVALYPAAFAPELFAPSPGLAGAAGAVGSVGGNVEPGSPSPAVLVRLVADDILRGVPPGTLTPLYLRRPDAAEPRPPKTVTAAG
ncbi:tRNA threonylcarbamoyl adenosine modification protein YeaZ [Frankia sp. EI5c]|uniref:tRNA (adenosine(37)-N6)-threonylcarbamoyltransferase complex dimerization subunit type 1 TsaB n=1 Tax=Frankia sp. EI5c TaxID=683316 RepID=UPI0007C2A7A9|nr:tRNA (adenosine(37)-N6)-threonylcarbamoyltransferase complex dimerization subunit type 1 TsaB [Frankia sp. EI5c]OAA21107.1 tRNA threonylcarbamoyl adenosine modification protein YeaZ [Frankia sp. EI5c]